MSSRSSATGSSASSVTKRHWMHCSVMSFFFFFSERAERSSGSGSTADCPAVAGGLGGWASTPFLFWLRGGVVGGHNTEAVTDLNLSVARALRSRAGGGSGVWMRLVGRVRAGARIWHCSISAFTVLDGLLNIFHHFRYGCRSPAHSSLGIVTGGHRDVLEGGGGRIQSLCQCKPSLRDNILAMRVKDASQLIFDLSMSLPTSFLDRLTLWTRQCLPWEGKWRNALSSSLSTDHESSSFLPFSSLNPLSYPQ